MDWQSRFTSNEIKHMTADQFTHNPRNPRKHPQRQRDAVRGSLETLGWVAPVIVNSRTGYLVDGHERVWNALDNGDDTLVPYVEIELDEAEEAQFLATFDYITYMAQYDSDTLDALLRDVQSDDARVQALLSELAAENDLYFGDEPEAVDDPGPQIDRADELREKWQTERGQLWVIPSAHGGEHRLLCGDSTNADDVARLMGGEKCEICFTSPPYNMGDNAKTAGYLGNGNISKYTDVNADDMSRDEYIDFLCQFTKRALSVCEYTFVNLQMLARNKIAIIDYIHMLKDHFVDVAIWNKVQAQPALAENVLTSAFEFIFVFSGDSYPTRGIRTAQFGRGGLRNVYESGNAHGNKFADVHAATFPIEFVSWGIVNFTNRTSAVYDPFGGSGTTMVACEQLGRQCRMMEIEPKYCAVILERMAGMGLTPRLSESIET